MKSIGLTLGSKLELEMYDKHGEKLDIVVVSQFETLLPDGSMEILAPIYEGILYQVHRHTQLDVIYRKNGDLYKFSALVLGNKKSGNIRLLRIKPTSNAEHFQRRTFFRFSCIMDIKYRLFDTKDRKKETNGEPVEYKMAIIKNLSGGGASVLLREKPEIGWTLDGIIHIGREVHFRGRIVRVMSVEDKGRLDYDVGVEFTEITNKDREDIISYIFELQRSLLKKGWHNI